MPGFKAFLDALAAVGFPPSLLGPLVLMVACGAFGWWVRGFIGKERLEAAQERLQVADDRIKLAEERQHGVAAENEKLQQQVNDLLAASNEQPVPPKIARQLEKLQIRVDALSTANNAVTAALTFPGQPGFQPPGLGSENRPRQAIPTKDRSEKPPRRALPID